MRWKTVPLYGIAKQKQIVNCTDRELLSVYLGKGVVPFSSEGAKRTNVTSLDLSKYQAVDCGDFVLNNQQAWRGSVGVSRHHGIVSPAYIVLKLSDDIEPFYANYLFQSRYMVDQYVVCSKGVGDIQRNIYWNYLKRVSVPLPPLPEQAQIVRYLDWKLSQINRLVNVKRRQIGLLQEQKRAVVNEAVTRGGEGWQKRRLKTIARITYGLGEPPTLTTDGIPIIRATNIERGKIVSNDLLRTMPENIPAGKDVVLSEGDIIVVRSGAYSGDVGFITKEWSGSFAGYDMLLRIKLGEPRFLLYALLSEYVLKGQWNLQRIRSAQPHLNAEDIGSSYIFFPPVNEQKSIFTDLDEQCGRIDKIIIKLGDEITLLHEYRIRLISDVVTGKMDVRDVTVPEHEAVEEIAVAAEDDAEEAEGEEDAN